MLAIINANIYLTRVNFTSFVSKIPLAPIIARLPQKAKMAAWERNTYNSAAMLEQNNLEELARAANSIPQVHRLRGHMICPNSKCDYVGKPEFKARGSFFFAAWVELIQLVWNVMMVYFLIRLNVPALDFWIIISLNAGLSHLPIGIYYVLRRGYNYRCPTCGFQVASDA